LPPGQTLQARVFRHGLEQPVSVPWLDNGGVDEALVRLGRGSSLTGAPVVNCLALRVELADGSVADVLLRGRPSRRPARDPLLVSGPYVFDGGLISLGARQCGAETFELSCRTEQDDWRGFADLRVSASSTGEPALHADPATHLLPGLDIAVPAPRAS
jgi:hypothetical protein